MPFLVCLVLKSLDLLIVFICKGVYVPVFICLYLNHKIKHTANHFAGNAEIVTSLSYEAAFYVGLAIFLLVTDRVQRPYLQFSTKRWGLITGLRGYLASAFFTTGFKVIAPLFAVYVTWPLLGLPALVSVVPFLVGCVAQLAFETGLEKQGSSCWPLVPIIFEVDIIL